MEKSGSLIVQQKGEAQILLDFEPHEAEAFFSGPPLFAACVPGKECVKVRIVKVDIDDTEEIVLYHWSIIIDWEVMSMRKIVWKAWTAA
jgi:hypothetical protein